MNIKECLLPLTPGLPLNSIGNKAHSLLFLQKHHCRIPRTHIVPAEVMISYLESGASVLDSLRRKIGELPDGPYAVRSSTSSEDMESHSFAGQFQSFTDVRGEQEILRAILAVWDSAGSVAGSEYFSRITKPAHQVRCAVILQEMVESRLAGVSFSKNPVNDLNEVIVEAVEGPGEDLVQKGLTPYRWRIRGDNNLEGPVEYRHYGVIKKIAADTARLRKLYGKHVDIEWAFDGDDLYYLQIRSIVGKNRLPVYSSKMAREMLPGQIKPLVWSINIPLVNGTWLRILSEIAGRLDIRPGDLTKSFYYRTYISMSTLGEIFQEFGLPPDSLEFMMGDDANRKPSFRPGFKILRHTFRIIRFIYGKLHFERTFRKEYASLQKNFAAIDQHISDHFDPDRLQEVFDRLFTEGGRAVYLNVVMPLLMRLYNRRLSKKLEKIGVAYDLLDFQRDFPGLIDFSPNLKLELLRQEYDRLQEEIRNRCHSHAALKGCPEAGHLAAAFDEFLDRFGHLSDSGTDCSVPKWGENPETVFNMMLNCPPRTSEREMIPFSAIRYSRIRHPGLKGLYRKAGKFKLYREQISSLYIYGYGLFRSLFLKVGDEFVNRGIIQSREDLFFLSKTEIDQVLSGEAAALTASCRQLVEQRKREMEESKDMILPTVIYGEEAPILEHGKTKNYQGVGTSSGTYRGKTKIIRGTADFSSVNRGDVLVIPFSDVSWTPILAQAGAIVSESGGILSHCSIIARELGIPALVSIENACALGNGLLVTIDGSNGILTIHDHEGHH